MVICDQYYYSKFIRFVIRDTILSYCFFGNWMVPCTNLFPSSLLRQSFKQVHTGMLPPFVHWIRQWFPNWYELELCDLIYSYQIVQKFGFHKHLVMGMCILVKRASRQLQWNHGTTKRQQRLVKTIYYLNVGIRDHQQVEHNNRSLNQHEHYSSSDSMQGGNHQL